MSDFQIRLDVHVDGNKAEQELNDLIQKLSNKQIDIKFNVKDLQTQLNTLKTFLNDAFKLDSTQINNLNQIKDVLSEINKLSKDVQKNLFGGGTSNLDKTKSSLNSLEKQINSMQSKTKNLLNFEGFLGGDTSKAQTLLSDLNEINNEIQGIRNKMSSKLIDTTTAQSEIERLEQQAKTLKQSLIELQETSKTNKITFKIDNSVDTITNKIEKLREKCIQLGESTAQLDKFEDELQQISNLPLNEQVIKLNALSSKVTQYGQSLPKATKNTRALGNAMKYTNGFCANLYSSLMYFSIGNMIGDQLTRAVGAIKDTIIDLDSAFRDLMKVAPDTFQGTTEQLEALREKASEIGQDVARSSVDIINSTASALQSGFKDVDKAMEFAKQTSIFANIADLNQEDSSKYLEGIMSAFGGVSNSVDKMNTKLKGANENYSQLNDFMDQSNFIGNNYALTTGDVSEALLRSASSAASAGLSMSETMAMIISAQETVKDAPKVG